GNCRSARTSRYWVARRSGPTLLLADGSFPRSSGSPLDYRHQLETGFSSRPTGSSAVLERSSPRYTTPECMATCFRLLPTRKAVRISSPIRHRYLCVPVLPLGPALSPVSTAPMTTRCPEVLALA